MEYYLKTLSPKNKKIFVKFRTANHHLPVETGRWHGKSISERLCKLCNSGQIGDEFHFINLCQLTKRKCWKNFAFLLLKSMMLSVLLNSLSTLLSLLMYV